MSSPPGASPHALPQCVWLILCFDLQPMHPLEEPQLPAGSEHAGARTPFPATVTAHGGGFIAGPPVTAGRCWGHLAHTAACHRVTRGSNHLPQPPPAHTSHSGSGVRLLHQQGEPGGTAGLCFKSSILSYQHCFNALPTPESRITRVAKACISHTRQEESASRSPDDSNQTVNP